MKKFVLAGLLMVSTLLAEDEAEEFEMSGFLTTQKCAEAGEFTDCYLENFVCGSDECYKTHDQDKMMNERVPLVLYNHDEGVIYKLDVSTLKPSTLIEGYSRNEVTIIGAYDKKTNTIHATSFEAPPPPKKSFFKGCL